MRQAISTGIRIGFLLVRETLAASELYGAETLLRLCEGPGEPGPRRNARCNCLGVTCGG